MARIARTTAALRFFGDTLEPSLVTALLGVAATEGRTKGEVIRSSTGRERIARTGSWIFNVDDRKPGDLDGQITEIFAQLTPDFSKWRQLSRFEPDLFAGLFMDASNEMLALNTASMSALADRGVSLTLDIYDPSPELNNIQIIDGADNATFSIFQVSNGEFAQLFPGGRDIEIAEDIIGRLGESTAKAIFEAMWRRPILKRDANGVHGTIYFDDSSRRGAIPVSKREVDIDDRFVNSAQRLLFAKWR